MGILVLMVFGHVAVWYPLYSEDHMSSTAVIAFFFIPFYCLGTMAIGLLIGWVISLLLFSEMRLEKIPSNDALRETGYPCWRNLGQVQIFLLNQIF